VNIALSTIVILYLVFPGIIFRRFYQTGFFQHRYYKQSVLEILIWAFVPAFALHTFLYFILYLANLIISLPSIIDLSSLQRYLIGSPTDFDIVNLSKSFLWFFLYTVTIFGLAVYLGRRLRVIVFSRNLDIKHNFFRHPNIWMYYFSGRIIKLPQAQWIIQENDLIVDYIYIDALVSLESAEYIYTGILLHYSVDDSNNLINICLAYATRRLLNDDDVEDAYYDIPGNTILLKYSTISNINFRYQRIRELES